MAATRHDTINNMSNTWALTGSLAFFWSTVTPYHALHWMTSFIFIIAIFRLLATLPWVFIWKLSNICASTYKIRFKRNVISSKGNENIKFTFLHTLNTWNETNCHRQKDDYWQVDIHFRLCFYFFFNFLSLTCTQYDLNVDCKVW